MLIVSPTARIVNEQAFRLGALSAQLEEMCIPEVYFRNPQDKRDFCAGYVSIAGPTLTTTQFLGRTR